LDFRAATTVLPDTLTTIPTGIPGARTSTIIRTPEIHIHIIPHLRDILIAGIGLTTVIIATTRARASKPEQTTSGIRKVTGSDARSQTNSYLF
jgi:hypothetical protein